MVRISLSIWLTLNKYKIELWIKISKESENVTLYFLFGKIVHCKLHWSALWKELCMHGCEFLNVHSILNSDSNMLTFVLYITTIFPFLKNLTELSTQKWESWRCIFFSWIQVPEWQSSTAQLAGFWHRERPSS